ncbi:tape measure protein [Microbacterium phage Franklin22]|uniref:tape measure protein n=1 Tax=Microbacterium phage Franklin22 TaxID=2894293 RepID=UPI001E7BCF28|nr:tape measure protein [Microbacterium phage Franklin22]UGL61829.1 tape measure protein [Microbacterium phage Franklin22]
MATGVELATAWVRLVPSLDGAQGEIAKGLGDAGVDDAAEEAGKKAGNKFSTGMKAAITLASGAIVGGVTKLFSDAITNASDLNEAGTAVQAIFGDATAGIDKWASTAATNLGQSQLEALNAAKSFGVFGQAAGLTNEENAKFSTGLASLASDFASFHNVSPQEAIEAIGAGLRGEAEPLRKFGVLMDDASLKAKAMEMGIYDGNGALDQSQKILAAQALITEQAGAAQGDFARTSDGLANQQRILDASLTDLSATVGQAFLPVMQGILSIAQPIVQFFQENPSLVIALAVALGVLTLAIVAANIAMWAMAANPIVLLIMAIVVAVGLLIAAIVWLVLEWDAVSKWIAEVWSGLMSWLEEVINGFVSWWNGVWEGFASWIGQVWEGFVSWIEQVWSGFISWITGVVNGFVSWWNSLWSGFGNWIADVWRNLTLGVQLIWQGWVNWITGVINGFVGWWNGIWQTVGDTINNVFSGIGSFIGGIWDGIVSGIRSYVNSIIRIVNGLIDGINNIVGTAGDVIGLNIRIPKIPMLAEGGTITRSGHVIVGENGPELLKLPAGAQVNPNYDDLPEGDGRQHFTFNNYAPLGSTPSKELETFANRSEAFLP